MVQWLSLFSSLLGIGLLYFGIRRSMELLLPKNISDFSADLEEHRISFSKTGRYEICVASDSRSWFRRVPESALFAICPLEKKEPIFYCPLDFSLYSRKGENGQTMIPLGYFKIFSPGAYRIKITTPGILKKSDTLAILPYISNSNIFGTFLMLLSGAVLFILGTIFFLDSLRGRL